MANDLEQILSVMEDARQEGNAAALAWLGAELALALGMSEAGGDEYGLWCRLEVESAGGMRVSYRMRWLWPGRFVMGSPKEELGRHDEEKQHKVVLSKGFWLGETPVTNALYEAVFGEKRGRGREEHPVVRTCFDDCVWFCSLLGRTFPRLELQLPDEAQWEYAARAGTTTAIYAASLGAIAWYKHNSEDATKPVGLLQPNAWGLSDMLGNVWEWCRDQAGSGGTEGAHRVLRGGAWNEGAQIVRAACRLRRERGDQDNVSGFRLAGAAGGSAQGRWYEAPRGRHAAIAGGTREMRLAMAERLARAAGEVVSGVSDQVRYARTEHGELFAWSIPKGPVRVPSGAWDRRDSRVMCWCGVVLFFVHVEVGLTEEDRDWLWHIDDMLDARSQRLIFVLYGSDDEELIALARAEALGAFEKIGFWRVEGGLGIAHAVRVVLGDTSWAALAGDIEATSPLSTKQGALFVADAAPEVSACSARLRGVLVAGALAEGTPLRASGTLRAAAVLPVPASGLSVSSAYLELTLLGEHLERLGELTVLQALPDSILVRSYREASCELLEQELFAYIRRYRAFGDVSLFEYERDAFCIVYRMDEGMSLSCVAALRPDTSSIELSRFQGIDHLDERTPGDRPLSPQELCEVGGDYERPKAREDLDVARWRWQLHHHDRGIVELVRALDEVGRDYFGYTEAPLLRLTDGQTPGPAFWRRRGWRPRGQDLWEPNAGLFVVAIPFVSNME